MPRATDRVAPSPVRPCQSPWDQGKRTSSEDVNRQQRYAETERGQKYSKNAGQQLVFHAPLSLALVPMWHSLCDRGLLRKFAATGVPRGQAGRLRAGARQRPSEALAP